MVEDVSTYYVIMVITYTRNSHFVRFYNKISPPISNYDGWNVTEM